MKNSELRPVNIDACLRGDLAPCQCACYFGLDLRDLIGKLKKGRVKAAYRILHEAVIFPDIVTYLCDAPCMNQCALKDPLNIKEIEKGMLKNIPSRSPEEFNIPQKEQTVAVIGAGLAGLACALRLSIKKYKVKIFEKKESTCSSLKDIVPEEVYQGEIEREFKISDCDIRLNTEIVSLEDIEADAVFVATGKDGNDFGLLEEKEYPGYKTKKAGIFIGGELIGSSKTQAIKDGIDAARIIESYILSGRSEIENETGRKSLDSGVINITAEKDPVITDGTYTVEELQKESERCLLCNCTKCFDNCDLMQEQKQYPEKLALLTEGSINQNKFDPKNYQRVIASCTMCGNCGSNCPVNIDMEDFFIKSRIAMHREEKLSPAFYDFWIKDMKHADGDKCAVKYLPSEKCRYVFFPGCRLGAVGPEYVLKTYRLLKEKNCDTGIVLRCCGAPAIWSGDEKLSSEVLENIRDEWKSCGEPEYITACPNCTKIFKKYLPEIPTVSIYRIWNEWELPVPDRQIEKVALFDPCTANQNAEYTEEVRKLLEKWGVDFEELPSEGCCGYGGNIRTADGKFAKKVTEKRTALSGLPYLTYCINCKEFFMSASKETTHILDHLLDTKQYEMTDPTKCRRNRERLKREIMAEYMNIELSEDENKIRLIIPSEVREKMAEDMISEDDIIQTIEYCENSGNKVRFDQDNVFAGHFRIGALTYWAKYKISDEGYEIIEIYSHRLVIGDDNHE